MQLIFYTLTVIIVAAFTLVIGIFFIHAGPGPLAQRFLLSAMFIILAVSVFVPASVAILGRHLRKLSLTPTSVKPAYEIHSWLGVIAGAVLFVVCFSGSVAMLEDELAVWENPSLRLDLRSPWIETDDYARAVAKRAEAHGDIAYVYVSFPRTGKPYFDFAAQIPGKSARTLDLFEQRHLHSGDRLSINGSHLSKWLRDFHSDLSLRQFNGRYVVGVLGLFMMILITSGVIIHAKIFTNLFTWRLDAPAPMRWRDSHNALAVWSLIFAFILAYSGTAIALIKPMLPLLSAAAFPGDPPPVYELFETLPERAGTPATMMNFDDLIALAQAQLGDAKLLSLRVFNWGDENARAVFLWRHESALAYPSRLEFDAVTGDLISKSTTELGGYAGRIHAVLAPLHFGLFGGNSMAGAAMKLLYALLGLACALTCSTGVTLWLEKRRKSKTNRRRADRLLVGVCAGAVFATCLIVLSYKAATLLALDMHSQIGAAYCLAWGASVMVAVFVADDRFAHQLLLGLSAACLSGAAILDVLFTTHTILTAALAVDIIFLIIAVALSVYIYHLGKRTKLSPAV